MKTLTLLHFTDLHQGMTGQRWLFPLVRDKLLDDLTTVHKRTGPIDLILFTGDLTQAGSKEQFGALSATLEGILAHLAELGSTPALLAIPGNHDLVRPPPRSSVVKALAGWHEDPSLRDALLLDQDDMREYRELVDHAFAPFSAWYDAWWAAHPAPKGLSISRNKGRLPGDFAATVERDDLKLAVVGLNSAFLQLTDKDYHGQLDLDPRQLVACVEDPAAWIKQHHAALLLTHHPLDWLHARALSQFNLNIAPPGLFTAHLFGHMHESGATVISLAGLPPERSIQGRSLCGFELKPGEELTRSHGYSVARIEIEGNKGAIRLWPRAVDQVETQGRKYWSVGRDPKNIHLDEDGTMTLPFEPRVLKGRPLVDRGKPPPKLQGPAAAYNAEWYVEREQHNLALDNLGTPGMPVMVWGPKLVGKTWLLKHVQNLALATIGPCRLIEIDLRALNAAMVDTKTYLGAFAYAVAQEMWQSPEPLSIRSDALATLQLTRFMTKVLGEARGQTILLSIDGVDEILDCEFRDDFFKMLRYWMDRSDKAPFSGLRLLLSASTTALTETVDTSPLENRGIHIELADFEEDEVKRLSWLHGLDWTKGETQALMELVGGHPYLLRTAMHDAKTSGSKLTDILSPNGKVFESHLDRYRRILATKEFREALGELKQPPEEPPSRGLSLDAKVGEKLFRLGVATRGTGDLYKLRYRLYERL